MKTLYERLEPEVLEGLEYNSKMYYGMTDKIVSELSSHKVWSDLKVGTIQAVITFSDIPFAKVTANTFRFGENIIKQ
tara:strand:+ start:640 stop:870 length:231 start_codon:yes stop_codon:yes gene_type:complete